MLEDRPVRVVFPDRGVDLEPPRQFDKELDVFALVELRAKARSTSES